MPHDRRTQGSLGGENLNSEVAAGVAGTQEELLFASCDQGGDDHAGFDDSVIGGSFADLRVLQHLLQGLDASFVQRLLITCRVVAAVFLEVAFLARGVNELGDMRTLDFNAFGEFSLQGVILRLGEPLGIGHKKPP